MGSAGASSSQWRFSRGSRSLATQPSVHLGIWAKDWDRLVSRLLTTPPVLSLVMVARDMGVEKGRAGWERGRLGTRRPGLHSGPRGPGTLPQFPWTPVLPQCKPADLSPTPMGTGRWVRSGLCPSLPSHSLHSVDTRRLSSTQRPLTLSPGLSGCPPGCHRGRSRQMSRRPRWHPICWMVDGTCERGLVFLPDSLTRAEAWGSHLLRSLT